LGPNVSSGARNFRIAVPEASIVSNTPTLPHHCGGVTSGKVMAKKMMIVAIISPLSRPAEVMY
jgi:hypothetical protein